MKVILYILGLFFFLSLPGVEQDRFRQKRERLVNDIRSRGIKDKATLTAMRQVERHKLVPENLSQYAYEDRPLPIGNDQTISQPYIVAYMTQAINPRPGMKVLEIGTGSGYQAAVLAEIVDQVYTIETVEPLARRAKMQLEEMGYTNIHYRIGDGFYGWEEHAPFDAIIVTAAPATIPPRLIEQLAEGGRMIIPVGSISLFQRLKLVEKKKNGKYTTENLIPVRFVPFTREEEKGEWRRQR